MANTHYTYQTRWNGLTTEVFNPIGVSIAFMQGDESADFLDEIEKIKNEEIADYYMSQYEPDKHSE